VNISADTLYSTEVCIDLDQDRTKWWVVVRTVMNALLQKYWKFLDKFSKYVIKI